MGPRMDDLNQTCQPDASLAHDRIGVPALLLAPSVLRIVIAGKDIETELDALVTAVTIVQSPDGFMRHLVFEMAVELARIVEVSGIGGLADVAKQGLNSTEMAMALQIGVVAVFSSPRGEDGHIGILAGIAERLGLSEADFTQAFESAQRAVARP